MITERMGKNYAKEFIVRTRELIRQYEEHVISTLERDSRDSECYDMTLLINCFYGLLMMPSKLNYNKLKKYDDAEQFLKEKGFDDEISFVKSCKRKISLEEFVRSIRNGLGHWEEHNPNYPDTNSKGEPFGLDYKPKNAGESIKELIVRGSIADYKIDVSTTFKVSAERNQHKIWEFLEFLGNIIEQNPIG